MRILLVIGAFSSGGAERVMSHLANYFAENDDEVTLVAIKEKKPFYALNEKVKLINGVKGKNPFVEIFNLRRNIKKSKPEIILSFLVQINIATIVAAIGLKIPVVVSERNDPNQMPAEKGRKLLRAFIYPLASGFVFQTEQAMNYFGEKVKNKSIVIPNPIFMNIKPTSPENRTKEIVSVGRLAPQKNHKHIILAFKKLANKLEYINYLSSANFIGSVNGF